MTLYSLNHIFLSLHITSVLKVSPSGRNMADLNWSNISLYTFLGLNSYISIIRQNRNCSLSMDSDTLGLLNIGYGSSFSNVHTYTSNVDVVFLPESLSSKYRYTKKVSADSLTYKEYRRGYTFLLGNLAVDTICPTLDTSLSFNRVSAVSFIEIIYFRLFCRHTLIIIGVSFFP